MTSLRRTLLLCLLSAVGVLALAGTAAAAPGDASARDCITDGRIDGFHATTELVQGFALLDSDAGEYSDCRSEFTRAIRQGQRLRASIRRAARLRVPVHCQRKGGRGRVTLQADRKRNGKRVALGSATFRCAKSKTTTTVRVGVPAAGRRALAAARTSPVRVTVRPSNGNRNPVRALGTVKR